MAYSSSVQHGRWQIRDRWHICNRWHPSDMWHTPHMMPRHHVSHLMPYPSCLTPHALAYTTTLHLGLHFDICVCVSTLTCWSTPSYLSVCLDPLHLHLHRLDPYIYIYMVISWSTKQCLDETRQEGYGIFDNSDMARIWNMWCRCVVSATCVVDVWYMEHVSMQHRV